FLRRFGGRFFIILLGGVLSGFLFRFLHFVKMRFFTGLGVRFFLTIMTRIKTGFSLRQNTGDNTGFFRCLKPYFTRSNVRVYTTSPGAQKKPLMK
ncbi:hypothetical protein ACVGV8_09665, partial [Enterobacter intestinihominis]